MTELEEVRSKLKKRYMLFITIIIITILYILSVVLRKTSSSYAELTVSFSVPLIILEIVLMFVFTRKLKVKYRSIFKKTFVKQSLSKLFNNLNYEPSRGIPSRVITETNMMNMGDIYHSEDYVSGEYKGIKFEQADVHIQEEHHSTDSEGHTTTTYVTIFKGRWMIFDFNKNFKADVQISQKGFGNSKVKRFFVKKEERFKRVKMESEEFNKKFKVFAQNEHDAFYLITPSLMERIERISKNNKGKFLFCFINNKLHVGIHNGKDSFEPTSVFKELIEQKILYDISKDIRMITQFVDELNLDNNLFKMEV